jgi:iron(III) transport system ATP-binding protein
MLKISGLARHFTSARGAVSAVRGLSLEVAQGEFFTLLGPSGCGKTTTLQCIAGLETPDAGEISSGNAILFSGEKKINVPGHLRNIGMVFQSYAIWPHMTVAENVAFPLVHGQRRVSPAEARARAQEALKLVQLDGLGERPAPFLSGGQQQRVALARAIVHRPALLLLDEPLSNLDATLRDDMQLELRQLVTRLNITTIYVTHDQREALSMSDRIAVMQNGQVVQLGTPRQIYFEPRNAFVASFIGRSNFLKGRMAGRSADGCAQIETPIGSVLSSSADAVANGDAVVLAIRPESVVIEAAPPAAGQANCFSGTVEHGSFIGSSMELRVRVGDTLLSAVCSAVNAPQPGQTVQLHVPPARCVALPGDDSRG